jgi:hypothetical protein
MSNTHARIYRLVPPKYFAGQTVEYVYHHEGYTKRAVVEMVETRYTCAQRAYHIYSLLEPGRSHRRHVTEDKITKALD